MTQLDMKPDSYLRLSAGVSVKSLEAPFLYDTVTDELYEINEEAAEFITDCDGGHILRDMRFDDDFLAYCIEEGLLEALGEPSPVPVNIYRSPIPSLRYLELQITHRCNRSCRHCYLGPAKNVDMSIERVLDAMGRLERMGGLRAMISGGEPLLHPKWDYINSEMERFEIRRVLLTNGELITPQIACNLNVHEVQVSIDGMEKGHDALRGKGSWKKAIEGVVNVIEAGLDLSIATMVHRDNLDEFKEMSELFREIEAQEWGIDVPCISGRIKDNADILPAIEDVAPLMQYAFGGRFHGRGEGYACGLHLATITPEGEVIKCGFYPGESFGNIDEGLEVAWSRKKPVPIDELECGACKYISECAGGCRYRAPSPTAPDPVMCVFYGGGSK